MTTTYFLITVILGFHALTSGQSIGTSDKSIGKCGAETSAKFDDDVASIAILGNGNASFPSSLRTVKQWCETAKVSVKNIKEFSKKCLDNMSRQVTNVIVYGMSKQNKKICRNDTTQREAATNLACLNGNYASTLR